MRITYSREGKLPQKIRKMCCNKKGDLLHNSHSLYYCSICSHDWYVDEKGEVRKLDTQTS